MVRYQKMLSLLLLLYFGLLSYLFYSLHNPGSNRETTQHNTEHVLGHDVRHMTEENNGIIHRVERISLDRHLSRYVVKMERPSRDNDLNKMERTSRDTDNNKMERKSDHKVKLKPKLELDRVLQQSHSVTSSYHSPIDHDSQHMKDLHTLQKEELKELNHINSRYAKIKPLKIDNEHIISNNSTKAIFTEENFNKHSDNSHFEGNEFKFHTILQKVPTIITKLKSAKNYNKSYPYRNPHKTNKTQLHNNCNENQTNKILTVSNLLVLSAYYDNRRLHKTYIRLIVIRKRIDTLELLCGFINDSSTFLVKAHPYEMCENHAARYGGWLYSCLVPNFIQQNPCSINIGGSVGDFKNKNTVRVQIQGIDITTKRRDFGICVPPIYDVDVQTIVQFIEFSRILGASMFTFYINDISKHTMKALMYYKSKGLVDLVPWTLPESITPKDIWYNGQLASIQDCLFRNMNRVKYLSFNDLDEFIIPKHKYDWLDLINELELSSDHNVMSFSFKSAFFKYDITQSKYYKASVLHYLKRTEKLSKRRTKVIVKPEKVFEVGIHHVSRFIKDHYHVKHVNETIAFIHHYRPCTHDAYEDCTNDTVDTSIMKYAEKLEDNYMEALHNIKIFH